MELITGSIKNQHIEINKSAECNRCGADVIHEKLTLAHVVADVADVKTKKQGKDKLRCTFSKSRPPVHISWLINGKPVKLHFYLTLIALSYLIAIDSFN